MKDYFVVRSSLRPSLLRRVVFSGTIVALVGVLTLLFGLFLPNAQLNVWGIPLFICGMLCITCGLLPYRRLTKLERYPHQIVAIEDQALHFLFYGKPALTIPRSSIERLQYREEKTMYGIAVKLKRPLPQKVVVHSRFNVNKVTDSEGNLFLPYFSQYSYDSLLKYW